MKKKIVVLLLALLLILSTIQVFAATPPPFDFSPMITVNPNFLRPDIGVIIPICDHDGTTHWETTPATCTAEGKMEKICDDCGAVLETIPIPKLAHVPGSWVTTVEPTCTHTGTRVMRCVMCSAVLSTETLPKLDHVPGGWITTKEATQYETGTQVKRCVNCGEVLDSRTIPKLSPSQTAVPWTPEPYATPVPYATPEPDAIDISGMNAAGAGTNRVLNSSFDKGIANWIFSWDMIRSAQLDGHAAAHLTARATNADVSQMIADILPSTRYTLSFYILGNGTLDLRFVEQRSLGLGTAVPASHEFSVPIATSGGFKRYFLSFDTQPDCSQGILSFTGRAGSSFLLGKIQLEPGDHTTPWTVSLKDALY